MNTLPDWFLREPAATPGTPVLEVAALWGDWLLDVRHLPLDGDLAIGDDGLPGPVDDALIVHGEVVVPHGCAAQALIAGAWGAWDGGDLVSGDRVVVRTAGFCWLIRLVPPGTRLPAAHESKREPGLLAALAVNGFLAVMVWVLAVTAPLPPEITMEEIGDQFVEVMLREAEPRPKKVVAVPTHEPEEKTEGAAAKRKSGKRGTQDGRLSRALEQRRSDRQIAEGAGFMGALNSELGEMFSATGLGGGVVEALGRSTGPSGRQFGTGLGWDGDGPGGGGVAEGMPGGTGTKGHGGDRSSLSGGEPTGKKRTGNLAKGGQVIQIGNMDAALIDQVVKQHLNQYRYCYQRELQKDYGLSGKVTLKWIIASDGSVSSANVKRETIENSAVTRCMVNVARRMQFPQPKGGIVIVSYPFLFSPG